MLRSLFSVAAICSLLFVSLAAPSANAARRRCPEEPPSTLLSLYKQSDAIYIGKFDKTVDGEVIRTDEHSQTLKVSDHFSISTTIKGESRKFFVRNYDEFRYLGNEVESEAVEEPEEQFEDEYKLNKGDSVVLFLKYIEDEGVDNKGKRVLDVAHYRDGVKRLGEAQISSYEARIRELKGIFSSKTGNDAEVLNWIMKCIEDPVTRWEGAYELYSSFQSIEWMERNKADEENSSDEPEADSREEGETDGEEIFDEEELFDNSVYAKLLTEAQKAHLADIAISSKPSSSEEKSATRLFRDGDRVLFDVVKRWGDSRLANAMLDRLRSTGDDNYEKLSWMTSISEVLKDKELSAISEKFGDATYQDDEEEVAGSKDENDSDAVDTPADVEGSDLPTTEPSAPTGEENSSDKNDDKAAKKTYKQFREELIADFIGKASMIIAQEKNKADAK